MTDSSSSSVESFDEEITTSENIDMDKRSNIEKLIKIYKIKYTESANFIIIKCLIDRILKIIMK